MSNLTPYLCPMCGGAVVVSRNEVFKFRYCECVRCGRMGNVSNTRSGAVFLWNKNRSLLIENFNNVPLLSEEEAHELASTARGRAQPLAVYKISKAKAVHTYGMPYT